ncbi:hypothetical protein J7J08_00655 [Stenotrophomonas sp. ISL-67]|uniref:hypothetical protein n=1 Tax=Stenotrophomonas sp. ISL-67 TaxID=2819171 RepID=UPI001BE88688|nr:hypothetical protein [Stenotrophomonas sp. ISL-67]MBT2766142.1 hypothetical protein [Stenotrophomonas sp. ISL-67]
MSRRVLMRAKMEDTLRANFQAAAARDFQSAATVLRQLMQAYVVVQSAPADSVARRPGNAVPVAAEAVARLTRPPRVQGDERDVEALFQRQYRWKNSVFGAGAGGNTDG